MYRLIAGALLSRGGGRLRSGRSAGRSAPLGSVSHRGRRCRTGRQARCRAPNLAAEALGTTRLDEDARLQNGPGAAIEVEALLRHIEEVRDANYAFLRSEPVPLGAANHERYGVSSTPTLVLVDREAASVSITRGR